MRVDLMFSQSKSERQRGGWAEVVVVGWGGVGGVSLWETFVTSVTALLDGWAASIWLQCM